jgi:simple sugar transport system ATP-binding protein
MKTDLIDIHKNYGGTEALKGACLSIHEGEVHCILGENGAGKTTLMRILSGFTRKTSGKIIVNGMETDFQTPADAAKAGIGMIHQEPLDFPHITVLDNFILGQKKGLFSSRLKNKKKLSEICRKFNFSLDQKKQTAQLQMSERHQLELAGLIASGTETVILDEVICGIPDVRHNTTVSALRQLADEGKALSLYQTGWIKILKGSATA